MIIKNRSERTTHPLSTRRRLAALIAAAGLGVAGLGVMSVAQAATGPFTIDGDVPGSEAGVTNLPDPSGNSQELGPVNSNSTKLSVINSATPPMLGYTNPNGQTDLKNAWLATGRSGGDIWLYFAWERDANRGSGVIMFEFDKAAPPTACDYSASDATLIADCNPWANRAAGDFVIVWDQQGGGTALAIRTFENAPGGGLVLGPNQPIAAADGVAQYSTDKYRGEAAINLSELVFGTSPGCTSFANVIPGTVTGNSDSADYKDTVFARVPPISNCGTLVVNKLVVNDNGGTKIASDFKFQVNGGTATTFVIPSASKPLEGQNTITDLTPGNYSVVEYGLPVTGYDTTYANSANANTNCTNLAVEAGGTVTCTITNNDNKASPSGTTVQSWVLHDSLAITGLRAGASDAGSSSVTFRLYSESTCTTLVGSETDSTIVSGAAATTTGVAVSNPGTYWWRAEYSGDAYNNGFTTTCGAEITRILAKDATHIDVLP